MFGSVADDFDPSYWARAAVAVLIADVVAVMAGTAWLLVELGSRIVWFLLHLLLTWLVPPALVPALLAPPPITLTLVERLPAREIDDGVAVSLDDMGDPAWDPTPDPVYTDADLPPPPEPEMPRMAMLLGSFDRHDALRDSLADLDTSVGLLAILGSSGSESGALADLWSDDGMSGGIGGLIGSTGDSFGSGGLGVGGLGTRGTGSGGGGTGYGTISGLGGLGTAGGGVAGGVVGGTLGTGGRPDVRAKMSRREPVSLDASAWEALGDAEVRCRVQATVTPEGDVTRVRVMACPAAARSEVERAVKASTWEPARNGDGEAVDDTVNVTFVLKPPTR